MRDRATDAGLVLRLASPADQDAVDQLMKESTRELFPGFYDERQTASSIVHVAHVDPLLIEDRTYFVIEAGGEIVACGGWSKRDKLYTGSTDQESRSEASRSGDRASARARHVRPEGLDEARSRHAHPPGL